jgi:sirohydrochlorin cobaltochelatase
MTGANKMKTVIVLAMHGAPPRDFPRQEMGEFFALHSRMDHAAGPERAPLQQRYAELEKTMRSWPRTAQNDRFWAASHELASHLSQATGHKVLVGFNEFCAPDLDEALDQAVARSAEQVIVVTPMMTRGGEHAEVDIPEAVRIAQERHPAVSILYVWPFDPAQVAQFLAAQIERGIQ